MDSAGVHDRNAVDISRGESGLLFRVHQICSHSGSHNTGGKTGWTDRPLTGTVDVRYRGEDCFLHIEHARFHRYVLLERPADDRSLRTARVPFDREGAGSERKENMLLKLWIDRAVECVDHHGTDALFEFLKPSSFLYPTGQLITEQEADDKSAFPFRGCVTVVENGNGYFVGVQLTEGFQPGIKILPLEIFPGVKDIIQL